MNFWISDWISGFHSGFLDFTVDFCISGFLDFTVDFCISGFLDFTVDFWISVWISVWISADGVRDFFRDGPLELLCSWVRESLVERLYSLSFYCFPADPVRRAEWVAAVRREKWEPTEHSWLCSAHFVSGSKSNDRLSPDYVPSVFSHTKSPRKCKAERDLQAFTRRKEARKKRSDASMREVAS